MESLKGKTIGFGMTGSFCMYEKIFAQMEALKTTGADLIPVFSDASQNTDCRFGKAEDFIKRAETISSKRFPAPSPSALKAS